MGVKNYHIDGISGVGKTAVAEELEQRGFHVVHGDRVLGYVGDPTTGQALKRPMQPVSMFTLEKHEGPYEEWPSQTRLFVNGQYSGNTVPGFVVEAQYRCAAGYLLILSQDCPFEESNDFILLDHAFNTIARSGLGVMYDSFLIEKHWPLSDTTLALDYGENLQYVLSIKPRLMGGVKLTVERH